MAVKMLEYIDEQPAVWRRILAAGAPCEGPRPGRVVIIGSGSSYFAALMAKELFELRLGIPVTAVVPTRTAPALALAGPGTVFWAVSQSGKSTCTIAAAQAVRKAGHRLTAVTSDAASPVARACDAHVPIDCGEETVPPKTKGMTATVLTLYLMGLALAGKPEETRALTQALGQSAGFAAANIAAARRWVEARGKALAAMPHLHIAATGVAALAANECALKLLETLYVPASAHEFEEYLHGIQYTIAAGSNLFLIVPDTADRPRMLRMADFHTEKGGATFIIATGSPTGAKGELCLQTSGDPHTLPFEVLPPFQLAGALVSRMKGHDVDKPKFPEFYDKLQTKLFNT